MVSHKYSFPRILVDIKLVEGQLSRGGEKEMSQEVEGDLGMKGQDLARIQDTSYELLIPLLIPNHFFI